MTDLNQGVLLHGHDFDTIARRLLPHRHSHILHKLWKQLHKHKYARLPYMGTHLPDWDTDRVTGVTRRTRTNTSDRG